MLFLKTPGCTASNGKKFTPHGLRHLFAVQNIRKCAESGDDFSNWIEYLCRYMGHKHIKYTLYYLHMTSQLFPICKTSSISLKRDRCKVCRRSKTTKMFFIYTKGFLRQYAYGTENGVQSRHKESLNSFRLYMLQVHNKKVDDITFEYVTEDLVRQFTSWVAENNSVGTRNIRLSAIKSYLQYANTRDIEIIPSTEGIKDKA